MPNADHVVAEQLLHVSVWADDLGDTSSRGSAKTTT